MFFDHLRRMCHGQSEYDHLVEAFAALVQDPSTPWPDAIYLKGIPGNGKTIVANTLRMCIPRENSFEVGRVDLLSRGNEWAGRRGLVVVSEVSKDVFANVRRHMVFGNKLSFLLLGNARMPESFNRTWCVEDPQRKRMYQSYYASLAKWLETGGYQEVKQYLLNLK